MDRLHSPTMRYMSLLCLLLLVQWVTGALQVNLHWTEGISELNDRSNFEHDCLRIAAKPPTATQFYQIIPYCLTTDRARSWTLKMSDAHQPITFAQLAEAGVTSEQLYHWSSPMDTVERYQLFLDTDHRSSTHLLAVFYNCSASRFGSSCQYSIDIPGSEHDSLSERIQRFYDQRYDPNNLTCYVHLECHRDSTVICLDWTEICDGFIDCATDALDEKPCWQMEINECDEDEYRCNDGQCIAKAFVHDDSNTFECLDRSNNLNPMAARPSLIPGEPTVTSEDITCAVRTYNFEAAMTSSCVFKRDYLLKNALFSDLPDGLSENCWFAVKCLLVMSTRSDPHCRTIHPHYQYGEIINASCPTEILIPSKAIAFGHIRLLFHKSTLVERTPGFRLLEYICYDDRRCRGFVSNASLLTMGNLTCRHLTDFPVFLHLYGRVAVTDLIFLLVYKQLSQCNTIIHAEYGYCDSPRMYRCRNSSKCISVRRICDGIIDCDEHDDETCSLVNGTCVAPRPDVLFQCPVKQICISLGRVGNVYCDCGEDEHGLCADEPKQIDIYRKTISFATMCDGFVELAPISIEERNETDETECEHWPCDNAYTHCDTFWNCPRGEDELNCPNSDQPACPAQHHRCISVETYTFVCLPLQYVSDGQIHCLGATDEPKLCQSTNYGRSIVNIFCKNASRHSCVSFLGLCNPRMACNYRPHELSDNPSASNWSLPFCTDLNSSDTLKIRKFFASRPTDNSKSSIKYFSLTHMNPPVHSATVQTTPAVSSNVSFHQRCHRGLPIRVWLDVDRNVSDEACLCPPSFYGDQCEYQNQRVSLTMRFHAFSDSRRTALAIVVLLIDDSGERTIHSSEQFIYLYTKHCQRKFNTQLLYSVRPKNLTVNYSIHIDVYEKHSFDYRGSYSTPLKHPFLPVHRVAVQLPIPRLTASFTDCSDPACVHGQCTKYFNRRQATTFCRCRPGWSGQHCDIRQTCSCAFDSICVGVAANNRSICVCRPNRWGPHCHLRSLICQPNSTVSCQNGGQCITMHEDLLSDPPMVCLCPKGFSGDRCEIVDSEIHLSFRGDIPLPQSILVHFIRVLDDGPPENGSTFHAIPIYKRAVTIRWSSPFHIVFVELFTRQYYLIGTRPIFNRSNPISKTVHPSDRCPSIEELLGESITRLHPLRRMKLYHLVCSTGQTCFSDVNHFCLCEPFDGRRDANCFEFNSSIQHDCFGQSDCENEGICLQDRGFCPTTSMCVCRECYFGTRCQLQLSFFGLSLDAILGYHIQPHLGIAHQSAIVKTSAALIVVVFVAGLINAILSFITFRYHESRQIGCGIYLFASTFAVLLTMTMCGVKFGLLLLVHMREITNRSFLFGQCLLGDFLLKVALNIDQWLNACVALERAITTLKKTKYDKTKSRRTAKLIVATVVALTIGTMIHDPIHRRLFFEDSDESEQQRVWCIARYSPRLKVYDTFINIAQFALPFLINIISAVIIIISTTRQRATASQKNRADRKTLYKQLRQHKHLLIAPALLIALALPRLIISLKSGCMKSSGDAWLFLAGYLVSFLPSTSTFVIFVLPSKLYKDYFRKSLHQYQQKFKLRVRL